MILHLKNGEKSAVYPRYNYLKGFVACNFKSNFTMFRECAMKSTVPIPILVMLMYYKLKTVLGLKQHFKFGNVGIYKRIILTCFMF